ncbi:hypothetical protein SeLEV6574_g01255 [Synchytrium endobioticum]|uniref:RNA helicase n=1 Tax=Synchytrium endobioticum TaxID=286115 RepID=A0A507DDY8_9FUNG|nr:hypothetical protein SeLEV6574_g01255 [Synchytrium endobioticum]
MKPFGGGGFLKPKAAVKPAARPFSALDDDDDDDHDKVVELPRKKLPPAQLPATASCSTSADANNLSNGHSTASKPYDPAAEPDDYDNDDWNQPPPKGQLRQHFVASASNLVNANKPPSAFATRSPSPPDPITATDQPHHDDDLDDDLDAFMAEIDQQVKQEASAPKNLQQMQRDELEEDDNVDSYIKFMKAKGVEVGKGGAELQPRDPDDIDSDEEVYRAAAEIDARNDVAAGIARVDPNTGEKRKDIDPLPPVDHSKIEYPEIEKNFYEQHPEIAALSADKVKDIRKSFNLWISGSDASSSLYYPCVSFGHFRFDDGLIATIAKHGYTEPTGIQRQAVPIALTGRDIIGIAKTGSGKTAAFIWPMLAHIMDQEALCVGDGPIGLILAPTRELAQQIYIETKKFARVYNLNVSVVYGGASKADQFKEMRRGGIEIVVATPGRLIDLVKMKATNLRRVSYLVLDEADRMFDLGFEPQVRSICNNVRPDRQTLLFSATFPRRIEVLARDVLTRPIKVTVGGVGQANTDITQHTIVLPDDSYKWDWLATNLRRLASHGSTLVFVSRKAGVDELALNLKHTGFACAGLHGDLPQAERDAVVSDFKNRKISVLVSTDVAARGLDIKTVKTVINYDAARDLDSHIHRIGRTGRAGDKGDAYSLVTQDEDKFAGDLVHSLEDAGIPVPQDLMQLAMKNGRFRTSRSNGGGGRGARGRGRGRGGRGKGRGGFNGSNNPNLAAVGRGGPVSLGDTSDGGSTTFIPGAMSFMKAASSQGSQFRRIA